MNSPQSNSSSNSSQPSTEQLRAAIRSQFSLDEVIVTNQLRRYFLRRWHTASLLALIKDGCINYERTKFQVEWKGGKVAATSSNYCYLSFREPYGKLVMPVVLVKPYIDGEAQDAKD